MDESANDRSIGTARFYEYCEGALGKVALIFETRSKANLHNRNALLPLPLFTFSSFPRSNREDLDSSNVRSFVDPCFLCAQNTFRGEGGKEDREGFVKDLRFVDSEIYER